MLTSMSRHGEVKEGGKGEMRGRRTKSRSERKEESGAYQGKAGDEENNERNTKALGQTPTLFFTNNIFHNNSHV
jgi:hypothetical protein